MVVDNIYYGTIMRCDVYKDVTSVSFNDGATIDKFGYSEHIDSVYMEDALLAYVHGVYIVLGNLKNILDYYIVDEELKKSSIRLNNNTIISTRPFHEGSLFVSEDSLRPYYIEEDSKQYIKQFFIVT